MEKTILIILGLCLTISSCIAIIGYASAEISRIHNIENRSHSTLENHLIGKKLYNIKAESFIMKSSLSGSRERIKQSFYSSSYEIYEHHVQFKNVCYQDSNIYLLDNSDEEQKILDNKYWSSLNPQLGLSHRYINSESLTDHIKINGSTFMYILVVNNIAQFYRELTCHMPVLISQQYRSKLGNPIKFDTFFAPNVQINNRNSQSDLCESQLKWMIEATKTLQSSPINIIDRLWYKNKNTPMLCFDKLTLYQPNSCEHVQKQNIELTQDQKNQMKHSIKELNYDLKHNDVCELFVKPN